MNKHLLKILCVLPIALASACGTNNISQDTSEYSIPMDSSYIDQQIHDIYLIAVDDGYTGTYEEWLASIRGEDGFSLITGTIDPANSIGKNGDSYLNITSFNLYIKENNSWRLVATIKGEQGPKGNAGERGSDGANGVSITSVRLTSTDGLIDTYTVFFSNNTSTSFTVRNGRDGSTSGVTIGANGNWYINGVDSHVSATAKPNQDDYCTITLNANGGYFDDGTTIKELTRHIGSYMVELPIPISADSDYYFMGWVYTRLNNTLVAARYVNDFDTLGGNVLLSAYWQSSSGEPYVPSSSQESSSQESSSDEPSSSEESSSSESSSSSSSSEEPEPEPEPYPDTVVASRMVKNVASGNNPYMEVDGEPFTLLGAQVRTDLLMDRWDRADWDEFKTATAAFTPEQCEIYFQKVAEFGFNSIAVPIEWRRLEPIRDSYDWSLIDTFMGFANKYNIKMEILWFSTNFCGTTNSFNVPDYIFNEYPCYYEGHNWHYGSDPYWNYGYQKSLVLNDPGLMQREAKVLTKLMNHIYEWNEEERKQPVISVQIHNEADNLARWRVNGYQYDLYEDSGLNNKLTGEEAWTATLQALNNAGQAVHAGKYKCLTRVNMCVTQGNMEFSTLPGHGAGDVWALDGIDILGDDPYPEGSALCISTFVNTIKAYKNLTTSTKYNYSHIAEGKGDYQNTASYILACVANRGGYVIYDFACPQYCIDMQNITGQDHGYEQGVVRENFADKSFTPAVRNMVRLLNNLGPMTSLFKVDKNFVAFNIASESPISNPNFAYQSTNATITFRSSSNPYGVAIEYDDYIYFAATGNATFQFSNIPGDIFEVETGYFDGSNWVRTNTSDYTGLVSVTNGNVYRVSITD